MQAIIVSRALEPQLGLASLIAMHQWKCAMYPAARAHERVHVQKVRDFPQTKLDYAINSPFLLNERGDPRSFFYVLKKKKSWIVEHDFFGK